MTLLRVFCSCRMRNCKQHLDEVIGAYNSTRHATTGFSPNLSVSWVLSQTIWIAWSLWQKDNHDFVRRKTHQGQHRQKMKYNHAAIRAKTYDEGDPVWVFFSYVTLKGTAEVDKGLARNTHGCACTTGWQWLYPGLRTKIAFRALESHHGGPTAFVLLLLGNGKVVVVMVREPERSAEKILDDCSLPSYREEEPSVWKIKCISDINRTPLDGEEAAYPNASRRQSSLTAVWIFQFRPRVVNAPAYFGAEPPAMSHLCHFILPLTWRGHYPQNMKLWRRYLNCRMFRSITIGYICSALDKSFIEGCVKQYS